MCIIVQYMYMHVYYCTVHVHVHVVSSLTALHNIIIITIILAIVQ